MSTLALQLIQKAKEEKSTVFDLGRCGLKRIPSEVFELVWLEELSLCNQYFDYEQKKWIESTNKGQPNILSAIPPQLKSLQNLKTLHLNGDYKYGEWKIQEIPPLRYLQNLQTLDLRSNKQIKNFSSFVFCTRKLTPCGDPKLTPLPLD